MQFLFDLECWLNFTFLQVGLNETPLTKALISGHFGLAEKLIVENSDIDFLNDGKENFKVYLNL